MPRITITSTLATIGIVCLMILAISGDDCDGCYSKDAMIFRGMISGIAIMAISVLSARRYRQMEGIAFDIANQPLLETNEATEGVSFAAEGTIVSDTVIMSHFSETPCIYYHSILEERVGFGKNRRWKVVKNMVDAAPLFIQDNRGRLAIDIRNIDHDNSKLDIQYDNKNRKDHKWSEIDTEAVYKAVRFKENKKLYRKSEYVLKPNISSFVYGYVEKDEFGLVLREHERHPLIISRKNQKAFVEEFFKGERLLYAAHLFVFVGFALVVMLPATWQVWPLGAHLFIVFVGAVGILGSVVFTIYNRIVLLRNRLLNAWSNIDTELKRRHDLIPQFIAVVKGYMQHEKDIHTMLAAIRSVGQSDASDTTSHTELALVAEAYPELEASPTFQKLMTMLKDTEERIAYSRNFYNATVRSYNTRIQQFPFNLFARMFGFHSYGFIEFQNVASPVTDENNVLDDTKVGMV